MPTYAAVSWYQLPRYYDLVFASLNRREIAFLADVFDRYVATGGRRVLEPACGSGRLMEGLFGRGFQVDGFDLEDRMVAYASKRLRDRGWAGRVWQSDMAAFKVSQRYDMSFCLVSSFKYLLTEKAALGHLRSVAKALRPGGIYVLGFHLSEYADRRTDSEDWEGRRGRLRVECRIDSWPPERKQRRERLRARLLVHKPSATEAWKSEWHFRTYDRQQFLTLLRKVPEFEHIATHNFDYSADEEIEFGEEDLDNIVILRRR